MSRQFSRPPAARLSAALLSGLMVLALVSTSVATTMLHSAAASSPEFALTASALCLAGEGSSPLPPGSHHHLGDCCCPSAGSGDILAPPATELATVAAPATIRTGARLAGTVRALPASIRFTARAPPRHV